MTSRFNMGLLENQFDEINCTCLMLQSQTSGLFNDHVHYSLPVVIYVCVGMSGFAFLEFYKVADAMEWMQQNQVRCRIVFVQSV